MSVLEKIFEGKREEVATAKAAIPLSEIKKRAADAPPSRDFSGSLEGTDTGIRLIAEVKKASPSQGVIRPDFDPVQVARDYERAGATCLSVLTDVPHFQGSPENLIKARAATSLPCLRKDFICEEYQVYESRAWGADAILLIAAASEQRQLMALQALAWSLNMDALVEVHDEQEVEMANLAGARLVGVNNRNLADFTTDLAVSEILIPMIREWAFPISESALETHADVQRVQAAGAKGVLIGTTFCKSPDIEAKVREVMGW